MRAATKANWQDPEFRAYMSRGWARHCVRAAGLPLTRAYVDRAKALLVDGDGLEVVIDALICDARGGVI